MKSMKRSRAITLCCALLFANSFTSLAQNKVAENNLKLGTYVASVEQTTTANSDGFTVTDSLKMRIKIISIDDNSVKAQIILNNDKGNVSGKIDSEGKLQLEGFLTNPMVRGESEFRLTATVKDNTLTKGKYLKTSKYVKSKGEFNIATLEDED
jgi:hypothetical protein